jgi:glycolate oxidase iron-sulfur subunit
MYFCLGCLACMTACPAGLNSCGWLHAHNGEWELQQLARKQIDQFPPEQFDAIITNAAGCGSHLKHYAHLLKDDPICRPRAELWDTQVKDIHDWLVQAGIHRPANGQPPQTVTCHEACHLCHGQKITSHRRDVLRRIPNLNLVELPESTWCCGSAGIYNLIQPEMANHFSNEN